MQSSELIRAISKPIFMQTHNILWKHPKPIGMGKGYYESLLYKNATGCKWISENNPSETVRKAPIGSELKPQKLTKQLKEVLFRCSGDPKRRLQRLS